MKKGFTLIELLAVIVILAIIGIITIPLIGNVIEESKKQTLEASVRGIVEATDYFAISNDGVHEFIFDENNKGVTLKGESLDYSGNVDAKGKVYLDKDGNISLCLMNDNYYVYKNYNSGIIVGNRNEDSCNVGYDVLTNKYVAFLESEGSSSNVYSKDEVDNLINNVNASVVNNTNEITNVKNSINELQTSLSNYALKSELEETNTNVENLATIVNSNSTSINSLTETVSNHFKYYYLTSSRSDIVDCNDLPINSVGYTYNDTLNSPIGAALVFTYGIGSTHYRVQIAIQYSTGKLYTRGYSAPADTWSEWLEH